MALWSSVASADTLLPAEGLQLVDAARAAVVAGTPDVEASGSSHAGEVARESMVPVAGGKLQ